MNLHSQIRRVRFLVVASPLFLVAVACGDSTTTTDSSTIAVTSDEAQALAGAQDSYASQKAEIDACFATFDTCKAADGADAAACKTALDSCLPDTPPPPRECGGRDGHGGRGRGDGDGARPAPSGSASGSAAPPPPPPSASGSASGSAAPPPPPAPSGSASGSAAPPPREPRGDGGAPPDCDGGPGGPKPGFCGHVPLPDSAAIKACHDTLKACVDAGTDRKTCGDAEHACVKAAFDAAFQARCAALPADAPAEAKARCAEGVAATSN